jgi:hypothetical protein
VMPPDVQRSVRLPRRDPLERYFVTVHFAGVNHPRRIHEYGMDLFEERVQATEKGLQSEGLLSVAEILRLVNDGWEVTVHAPAHQRSNAHDVSELDEWLVQMGLK